MVSNLNSQYNVAMQAGNPQMQGIDKEKVKQSVDNSYIANRAKASEETNPAAMLGVGAGIWYGLGQAMDKFGPKCEGDYNSSILGKISNAGDKFSEKTYVGRKFEQFMRWLDNGFEKLSKKSKIVYTLRNHSTKPEWAFAKTPGAGVHGFLAADTEQIFEEFLEPITERQPKQFLGIPFGKKKNLFQKLEQYGMNSDQIKQFKQSLNGKTFAEQALALQKKELELLGVSKNMISQVESKTGLSGLQKMAKNFKVRKLGFTSMREYNSLKGKFLENSDKIMEVLERGSKHDFKLSMWRGTNKLKNHLFGRQIALSEYLNKYKATLGKEGKTTLGRLLPKATGWFLEGTTNRFAGGKLAVAMQAFIFADMLINTFKAPKGEKGKTFIERFVNDFTYFLALTAGIVGMHKVGGFKYAGLDNAGREAYRKALEEFNTLVKNGTFKTKQEYKLARKALKEKLNLKGIKNPITKLLQKMGSLINIGNERILSYRSPKKWNMNWLRKFANGNILGVPLRIIIPMFIVSPFLAKWATKAVHAVFGRPTKSVLDEEEEPSVTEQEKLQQQQLAQMIAEAQKQAQAQAQENSNQPFVSNNSPTNLLNPYRTQVQQPQQTQANRPLVSNNSPTNLLNMYRNGNPYKETVPAQTTQQQGTTQPTDNQQTPDEPVRTYIPSPEPVVLTNTTDMSPVDAAMKKADAAEKLAMETLAMRN